MIEQPFRKTSMIVSPFGKAPAKLRRTVCKLLPAMAALLLAGNCVAASTAQPPGRSSLRPHGTENLSASPANNEIAACQVFSMPLVAGPGKSSPQENTALTAALKQYSARTESDDFSALTGFLGAFPHSVWRLSLLNNLGFLYYKSGYYDKALETWHKAWEEGKTSNDLAIRPVVDRALAEYARMGARLGLY